MIREEVVSVINGVLVQVESTEKQMSGLATTQASGITSESAAIREYCAEELQLSQELSQLLAICKLSCLPVARRELRPGQGLRILPSC
jgi:hypothetical protein